MRRSQQAHPGIAAKIGAGRFSCHNVSRSTSVWIDCGFETALERAISRGQEGLPPEETTRDYNNIYNPAQEIHFRRDDPRGFAGLVVSNDEKLGVVEWLG